MKVLNVHERELQAGPDRVGALLDSLASRDDVLWPKHAWPRMELDRPLGVGARGGHGPISYFVEAYVPGESIRFRFTVPKGFVGFHGYEAMKTTADTVVLRHTLEMTTHGLAVLSRMRSAKSIESLAAALIQNERKMSKPQIAAKPRCPLRSGVPAGIRTPNLLIRSQMLYPVELRVLQERAGTIAQEIGGDNPLVQPADGPDFEAWCSVICWKGISHPFSLQASTNSCLIASCNRGRRFATAPSKSTATR